VKQTWDYKGRNFQIFMPLLPMIRRGTLWEFTYRLHYHTFTNF